MTRSIHSNTFTRYATAVVVGLALAGAAQTAAAEPRMRSPRQVEVHFGDLDLNKEAGAATLLQRLSQASKKVCNFPAPGPFNFDQKNLPSVCRRNAMEKAIADVDHPVLTALYQGSQNKPGTRLASR